MHIAKVMSYVIMLKNTFTKTFYQCLALFYTLINHNDVEIERNRIRIWSNLHINI